MKVVNYATYTSVRDTAAEEILAADPYHIGGVFVRCQLSPWEIVKANPLLIPAMP